jgi:hypothetical protein
MLIARVVAVEKNAPPTDVGVAYSTRTPTFGETPEPKSQSFSVEEQVVNDVKALAAWNTAKSKADEFMALATKDGWDKAVAQFNKLYGAQAKADPNDRASFAWTTRWVCKALQGGSAGAGRPVGAVPRRNRLNRPRTKACSSIGSALIPQTTPPRQCRCSWVQAQPVVLRLRV